MKRTIITVILTLAFTAFAIQAVEQKAFSGAGVIESSDGGFMFPDGTVQLTAANPPCTAITYAPYNIIEEGIYCFSGNLAVSITTGNAITIEVDNVVIDLNGWSLDGLIPRKGVGIYAYQRKNITIRNGTIRGFQRGVWLKDDDPFIISQGHLVEDVRADKCAFAALQIEGSDNIARRNQVVDTINTGFAYGISIRGPRGRALNNDIGNTATEGPFKARGLYFFKAHGSFAEGNRIADHSSVGGSTFGLSIETSDDVLVRSNSIINADNGICYLGSTGKYMDNLTSNVATPFCFSGTPIGIND